MQKGKHIIGKRGIGGLDQQGIQIGVLIIVVSILMIIIGQFAALPIVASGFNTATNVSTISGANATLQAGLTGLTNFNAIYGLIVLLLGFGIVIALVKGFGKTQ